MSGGYDVDPERLRAHASRVQAVAGRIDRVVEAADTVGYGRGLAYGLLCSPVLLPPLEFCFGDSVDMVKELGRLGHAISDAITGQAETYEQLDTDLKTYFDTFEVGGGNHDR